MTGFLIAILYAAAGGITAILCFRQDPLERGEGYLGWLVLLMWPLFLPLYIITAVLERLDRR